MLFACFCLVKCSALYCSDNPATFSRLAGIDEPIWDLRLLADCIRLLYQPMRSGSIGACLYQLQLAVLERLGAGLALGHCCHCSIQDGWGALQRMDDDVGQQHVTAANQLHELLGVVAAPHNIKVLLLPTTTGGSPEAHNTM